MRHAAVRRSRPIAEKTARTRLLVLGLLVGLAVGGLSACTSASGALRVEAAPAAPQGAAFITISAGPVVERSIATGRGIRTLAGNATSAAETSSGVMFYTSGTGCSSSITEATGPNHLTPLLHLESTARDLSVSTDGVSIAYLTYDHCPTNRCPGSSCAGAAAYGPNVLIIENVTTKHSTRLRTPQGSGIDAVSFSPDGHQFAMWLNDSILVMPTARPNS